LLGGVPDREIDAFMPEATAGGYSHLPATVVEWVKLA